VNDANLLDRGDPAVHDEPDVPLAVPDVLCKWLMSTSWTAGVCAAVLAILLSALSDGQNRVEREGLSAWHP
jgi:hypothetical protein